MAPGDLGVLVEAGGEADRVRQRQARQRRSPAAGRPPRAARPEPEPERADRQAGGRPRGRGRAGRGRPGRAGAHGTSSPSCGRPVRAERDRRRRSDQRGVQRRRRGAGTAAPPREGSHLSAAPSAVGVDLQQHQVRPGRRSAAARSPAPGRRWKDGCSRRAGRPPSPRSGPARRAAVPVGARAGSCRLRHAQPSPSPPRSLARKSAVEAGAADLVDRVDRRRGGREAAPRPRSMSAAERGGVASSSTASSCRPGLWPTTISVSQRSARLLDRRADRLRRGVVELAAQLGAWLRGKASRAQIQVSARAPRPARSAPGRARSPRSASAAPTSAASSRPRSRQRAVEVVARRARAARPWRGGTGSVGASHAATRLCSALASEAGVEPAASVDSAAALARPRRAP